ncbi:MAG: ABC transporter substrate-binding protein [Anaerolineae bacterium]|jgi:putative spermidine/putrescine transport system substrate-binding protein|nr:ABC transporter substrate-binding protein [Anaerolineae bacterium]MBT4312557.1 ABC transporter substrate-binding protein [Anaerolineae bacterium]MBT4457680.1 ABC transporter substrate-binding protein [Anaerolineae bacterium]MBT4841175.1 ABC transporter substrate-binding protein [Anaerolineae bacterium]MBT6062366.1 ABC transporter substrate-binding protein [Anaerolineae bacterium]
MKQTAIFILLIFSILLAACSPSSEAPTNEFDLTDWDSILAAAEGQTVNWYMWGGSDSINAYVDNFYGTALKERYNISLNRVPVADSTDYVNQILSEKEAGNENGAVDLMWINGENFFTLKQAEMLYADWAQAIPNSALVDWGNPAINRDFGEPVEDLESPWSSAQFQFIYDSARVDVDSLPRSYADLATWACEHPGRFTYIAPGPGAFQGTRFVKGALFELSRDAAQWGTLDEALWEKWSPEVWSYFNEFKTCLWREGETYPKDEYELHGLFANNEVDFSITQAIVGAGALIDEGLVPETSRAFVFDNYMIGDFNYVAIPSNASNKAAALVLANLILDPEFQAAQVLPENGFGLGFGIDVTRVIDPAQVAMLEDALENLGEAATPADDMAKSLVGDAASPYQALVEDGWRENVLIGK